MNISYEKHFTASVYILKEEHVLLIMHPKLKKWLPPGGHVEPNETPTQTARREVKEETGLAITFLSDERVWVEKSNAQSLHRPFLCLLEEIPPHKDQPAHQHIDFVYLATPKPNSKVSPCCMHPPQWFSFDEIQKLKSEEDIFAETQQVITSIKEYLLCPK